MNTLDCIFSRRSIRKYINKPIEKEKIDLLLYAGFCSPTANNYQEWNFLAINDTTVLNDLSLILEHGKMLNKATLAILVCADNNLQNNEGYQAIDCAASTQNILLTAHELGLGAVWLGIFPRKERILNIKKYFNLPQNINPITLIAIGYPDEAKEISNRFDKNKVHFNKW